MNPVTLPPLPSDGEPHSIPHVCLTAIEMVSKPQEDLSDIPLHNSGLLLFCAGSCKQNLRGNTVTGYAVVSPQETPAAYSLPAVKSARAAELIALTRDCTLAEGKDMPLESVTLLAQFGNPVDS